MQYWVHKNGQTFGPYDSFTIEGKVAGGELDLDDQVCLVGTEGWALIRDTFHAAENWTLNRSSNYFAHERDSSYNPNNDNTDNTEPKETEKFITHKCFNCNHIQNRSMSCPACGAEDDWQNIYDSSRKPNIGLFCSSCKNGWTSWDCENCGQNNAISKTNTSVPVDPLIQFLATLLAVGFIGVLFFVMQGVSKSDVKLDPLKPFKVYPDER